MKSIRSIYVGSVFLACAWSGLALAQNPEASQHFERGLSLAKQKAYPDAIAEFNRAYQISPHASVMYNLGQAYIAIDQPVYAVESLRRYLAEGGAEVPSARRQQVEDAILAQERRIATVTIRSDLAGAVVRLDGDEVGRTPLPGAIRVSAGSHMIEAFLPGYNAWEQRLVLAGQEQRIVDVVFGPVSAVSAPVVPVVPVPVAAATPMPAPPLPAAAPPTAAFTGTTPAQPAPADGASLAVAQPPGRSRARIATAIVLGVIGAGGIATGSVFGLRAFSKKSDSDKECPNERCTTLGVSLNNQAKDAATISTVTFGVGIVAAAVATYLLLKPGAPAASPPATSVSALELLPEVGNGTGRLCLRGVW
jgi:hypothetical protein